MEMVSELLKTVDLSAINTVLVFMIKNKPSLRLVKHIIRSYCRLAEKLEGKNLLKIIYLKK